MNKNPHRSLHTWASHHVQIRRSTLWVLLLAIWFVSTSVHRLVAQPPTIANQPQSLNVAPGMKAIFSVQASGSALRYQWQFNSNNIIRGTNFTLAITNVAPADAGDYQVVITNISGSVTSAPASLLLGPILAWAPRTSVPIRPRNYCCPWA